MRSAKLFSALFAVLAVLLLAAAVLLSFQSLDADTKLLGSADAADARAEALMEAICQGDYSAAGSMLYGQPELDTEGEASSEFSTLLWEAYVSSISYEFTGDCYTSGTGTARDVTITALDISGIMPPLKERYQALLKQRVLAADDDSVIYDDSGSYLEDFVMEVLCDAAAEVLAEGEYLTSRDITLTLVCQNGQWWVMPEQKLMNVLSGGMTE